MRVSSFYYLTSVALAMSLGTRAVDAQAPVARTPRSVAPAMVDFFSGQWKCDGQFPNGKAIAATMRFGEVLDGAWMTAVHDDTPPNKYHATALWGTPGSTGFVAYLADNGGGMRRFVALDGWKDEKLVLSRDTTLATARFTGRYSERFTYERKTATAFRMTYETALDSAAWKMGDTMLCDRS